METLKGLIPTPINGTILKNHKLMEMILGCFDENWTCNRKELDALLSSWKLKHNDVAAIIALLQKTSDVLKEWGKTRHTNRGLLKQIKDIAKENDVNFYHLLNAVRFEFLQTAHENKGRERLRVRVSSELGVATDNFLLAFHKAKEAEEVAKDASQKANAHRRALEVAMLAQGVDRVKSKYGSATLGISYRGKITDLKAFLTTLRRRGLGGVITEGVQWNTLSSLIAELMEARGAKYVEELCENRCEVTRAPKLNVRRTLLALQKVKTKR